MAAIHISAELERSVQQLADRLGFAKEDFVRDAIEQRLAEYDEEPELTEAQLAHFAEGVAQLRQGEYITSEQLDAKFDKLFQELEARAEAEDLADSSGKR